MFYSTLQNNITLSHMRSIENTKDAYTRPEAESICIFPQECILDVSNPGGTVTPIDPDEG